MRFPTVLLAISAVLLPALPAVAAGTGPELTDKQILERMATAYGAVESYRDEGRIEQVGRDGKVVTSKRFSTLFLRPDRVRFEFETIFDNQPQTFARVFVWDGEKLDYKLDPQEAVEKVETVDEAVRAAMWSSGGTSHTVPALLMPEVVGGPRVSALINTKRLADEPCGELRCFRIEGYFRTGRRIEVWIDQEDFTLRQVAWGYNKVGKNYTRIFYEPRLGASVAVAELKLYPDEE